MQNLSDFKDYFKTEEQLETKSAYSIDENIHQIHKDILELYLVSKSLRYSKSGLKYVIYSTKYEVHLAILPSGEFAYYTIHYKTKQKANYNQALRFTALTHQFRKLGIVK